MPRPTRRRRPEAQKRHQSAAVDPNTPESSFSNHYSTPQRTEALIALQEMRAVVHGTSDDNLP